MLVKQVGDIKDFQVSFYILIILILNLTQGSQHCWYMSNLITVLTVCKMHGTNYQPCSLKSLSGSLVEL